MKIVNISEFTNFGKLCRVCLAGNDNMTPLLSSIELKYGKNKIITTPWDLLTKVTLLNLQFDDHHPLFVCSSCMHLLKMAYKFKVRFDESQKMLCKFFGDPNENNSHLEDVIELIQEEPFKVAPVELISKQGKFDLNDVIIVENEKDNVPDFTGFLNNLGKEVSATFVNDNKIDKKKANNRKSTIIKFKNVSASKKSKRNSKFDSGEIIMIGDIYKCTKCQKLFGSKKTSMIHFRNIHLRKREAFVCEICGVFLTSRLGYKQHMDKHCGKQSQCHVCNKMLFNSAAVKTHIVAVHKNSRLYLCTVCGKTFNYSNALVYHMRIHTNEKTYKCSYCTKAFRMRCSLNRHLRTHTGLRPYKCSYCDKGLRSKGELNCHEMIHTGYRPFHCKYCGKGFTKKYNLNVHFMAHNGRHACDICGKTFIEVEFLNIHMKNTHL